MQSHANATSAPPSSDFKETPVLYDLPDSLGAARYHLKLGTARRQNACGYCDAQGSWSQYEGRSRRDDSKRTYTCSKSVVSSSTLAP